MKKSMIRLVTAAPALIGALAFSHPASAVVYSSTTALSACQFSSSPGTDPSQLGVLWEGLINQSTTTKILIDCGDSHFWDSNSNTGVYNWDISLFVTDRSTTENVSCASKIIDSSGIAWWSGATKSTSGSPGSTWLQWQSIGQYGLARVSCSIPKAVGSSYSGVNGFDVNHL